MKSGNEPKTPPVPAGAMPFPSRSLTLIGMPGSGKSVVGRILAARLGWAFLDTDRLIEQRHGRALQALIDRLGESAFRKLEEETVLGLDAGERTVIATGGSVVYSEAAMLHLARLSTVVLLDVSLEAIRQRIQAEAPRGIVGLHEGGLEELFQERRPLYLLHAGVVVEVTSQSAEQAAAAVLRVVSDQAGKQ